MAYKTLYNSIQIFNLYNHTSVAVKNSILLVNKVFFASLFLLLFLDVEGQNPERSKKLKKAMKKGANVKHDPYKIEWHDQDSDGDGVPNGRDKCIHTPAGEPVTPFGCPFDVDFDGLYDYEDSCKGLTGPKENHGCPWGDKDKDGFMDNVDHCPSAPGIAKFHGCPDTDGDGLMDTEDNCPTERGTIPYHGCPPPFVDADKDGVSDYDDLCPHTPGLKSNRGCPEIKKEELTALRNAFENLLFETNSDVIVSSSYPSLDELGKLMRNNPQYKLHLEGHTDNVGDDHFNMDLSQRRALSVKHYLSAKGVASDHLFTDGFGETRPVSNNDTEEGRHKNRRVEMTIIYPQH